ncbi:MAG: phosphatase PAP2 family protein, partial [Clostridia bacterium]|nr:phosphatase PAP2 family protein [Clostridia bacterium]
NLFPSIHCMTSYMVVRGTWKCRRLPLGYKLFCLFACIAIFASTLFVRQHLFADQIAAVALAEMSMLAERELRAGRLFDRLESRIGKGARR